MDLIHGDCMEVMRTMPDHSIDLILTDPPYGIEFQNLKAKGKRFGKIAGDQKQDASFASEFARILKPTGAALVFTRWDVQHVFINAFYHAGLKVKNILIWDKCTHGMGDLKRAYGSKYESIIFCANNGFRFPGKRPTDIIACPKVAPSKLVHPNEKPIKLLEILIEQTTKKGDIVFDAFMGSGTTGVACQMTERDFIGIELDEWYYHIARDRIYNSHNNKNGQAR